MEALSLLVWLPVVAAALVVLPLGVRWQYVLGAFIVALLSLESVTLFLSHSGSSVMLSSLQTQLLIALDVLLLVYFFMSGFRQKARAVYLLAALQLILYLWVESILPHAHTAPIVMDRLSHWMFLIINPIGGVIILYAVRYLQDEAMTDARKRLFLSYLYLFLGVMNLLVMSNDLMLFFFLFEMTTLASYLLIGFRGDETARSNALRALWMNQIGGVAILLGVAASVLSGGGSTFDTLSPAWLFPVGLLAVAAFVKGAFIPFDRWLLGAMVAPTPVSAILHSATMVKVAPFLVIKLVPLMTGSVLADGIALVGALVFVAAAYLALSKHIIKEILGLSTIAMLGLMVSLAALGTALSVEIALWLIVIHAAAKALLFLSAGVLEKRLHIKEVEGMSGLINRSGWLGAMFLFGFAALTLPPFGGLLIKLMGMEILTSLMPGDPWLVINLAALAIGSVLLTLLYFKVASAMLSWDGDHVHPAVAMGGAYGWGIMTLGVVSLVVMILALLSFGALWGLVLPLVIVLLLPLGKRWMQGFDRAREYHCGEQSDFVAAPAFFAVPWQIRVRLDVAFVLLFILVVIAGGAV